MKINLCIIYGKNKQIEKLLSKFGKTINNVYK